MATQVTITGRNDITTLLPINNIYQGQRLTYTFGFFDEEGTPLDLSGVDFRAQVRTSWESPNVLLDIQIGSGFSVEGNVLTLDIINPFGSGRYEFDIVAYYADETPIVWFRCPLTTLTPFTRDENANYFNGNATPIIPTGNPPQVEQVNIEVKNVVYLGDGGGPTDPANVDLSNYYKKTEAAPMERAATYAAIKDSTTARFVFVQADETMIDEENLIARPSLYWFDGANLNNLSTFSVQS